MNLRRCDLGWVTELRSLGPLGGATTRVMPQPLGGATSGQGAAPISRLHREAIPFLGMAASVVVVVQVLIMEACMDLALRLLFQARFRLTILVCL